MDVSIWTPLPDIFGPCISVYIQAEYLSLVLASYSITLLRGCCHQPTTTYSSYFALVAFNLHTL